MDSKVQMMDAGTALFEMKGGFGSALGQVKAEMSDYGTVSQDGDNLVLDFCSFWRKRYIFCCVEDAGLAGHNDDGEEIRRYAAIFKEGNRSTVLRGTVHVFCSVAVIVANLLIQIFFPELANFVFSAVSFVLAAVILYRWIVPSKKAVATVKALQRKVSAIR